MCENPSANMLPSTVAPAKRPNVYLPVVNLSFRRTRHGARARQKVQCAVRACWGMRCGVMRGARAMFYETPRARVSGAARCACRNQRACRCGA